MPKNKANEVDLDFAFYRYLQQFYNENKGQIRRSYRLPTRVFLDYNDKNKNAKAFLRVPQFEALEIYIFLKEFLKNAHVQDVFAQWYYKKGRFVNRKEIGLTIDQQMQLFVGINEEQYKKTFSFMKKFSRKYPNYIFALTMGTGKTILMATCILYEFILANYAPKEPHYCHNVLVFAPDRTVLESLREIQTFGFEKVVPPEYLNFIETHIQFHFLDDTGLTLNTMDRSQFNLIISNTQKIILKKQHKEKSPVDRIFSDQQLSMYTNSVYAEYQDLYGDDQPETEDDLKTNQKFQKLCRLEQLGIYVDEAHHAFGTQLAKDMGMDEKKKDSDTSLRRTIDELANSLERAGTKVVACYNFTGTPYVGPYVLPEVVYAYSLKDAIDNRYLKKVKLHGYSNPKTLEFVQLAVDDFWNKHKKTRFEGMLPKIAFFASGIEELENELKPALEQVLINKNIPLDKILVNVGDPKLTSSDEIREFNLLDTEGSEKQFILLVNKGREGWNCRSLFGVAMYRTPRSKVFVLQASMRCLRAIGPNQETANVYLSDDNISILKDELRQNFRMTTDDFTGAGSKKIPYKISVLKQEKLSIKRVRRTFNIRKKTPQMGLELGLKEVDIGAYKLIHRKYDGLDIGKAYSEEDISAYRVRRTYGVLTLVAEIARYLNRSPIVIEEILRTSQEGMDQILRAINEFNELLYDWLIPALFKEFYILEAKEESDEEEIELVKVDQSPFTISGLPELSVCHSDPLIKSVAPKSFHLDTYCFDSQSEKLAFHDLLSSSEVEKLYFTGMLTHGQTDFYVHYVDPETFAIRTYYPDFLIQRKDGSWLIIEIKGDDQWDDSVVKAKKEYAERQALASGMAYEMIKASQAKSARYVAGLV